MHFSFIVAAKIFDFLLSHQKSAPPKRTQKRTSTFFFGHIHAIHSIKYTFILNHVLLPHLLQSLARPVGWSPAAALLPDLPLHLPCRKDGMFLLLVKDCGSKHLIQRTPLICCQLPCQPYRSCSARHLTASRWTMFLEVTRPGPMSIRPKVSQTNIKITWAFPLDDMISLLMCLFFY